MIRGAGVLFLTPTKKALFLKRSGGGDWNGYWGFPGGTTEGSETADQTAIRETIEEIGFMPEFLLQGERVKHAVTRMPAGGDPSAPLVPNETPPEIVEFTTFVQRVEDTFEPRLNGESSGFAWAPIDDPPQPMHPGCMVALQKFKWDELDIAEAIRDGALASPQQYENMWLFALRITGTGVAYRPKLNEFVLRKPEDYLTDRFVARCNGLAVIVQHPKGNKLDSQEYAERNVGSMFLPYIKGDEVWGVAKIYDAETVEMLVRFQLSTSPAVCLWPGEEGGAKFKTEDGATILIEEKPKLLDHLAICVAGVWDKGEAPSGVEVAAIGDSSMATEAEKKEEKKADASGGVELDKTLKGLGDAISGMTGKMDDCMKRIDSVHSRLDSVEEERKKEKADAAEKEKADAAAKDDTKKDAAEPEKKEEKKGDATEGKTEAKEIVADRGKKGDATEEKKEEKPDAKGDSLDVPAAIAKLSLQLSDLSGRMPRPVGDADYRTMTDAQVKADNVFAQFGLRAPRFQDGEQPRAYRNRLANDLKKHSPNWKDIDIVAINDETFERVEQQIYGDASTQASMPEAVPVGQLRPVTRTLPSGHIQTTYNGQPAAWMDQFAPTRRYVKKINPIWKEH